MLGDRTSLNSPRQVDGKVLKDSGKGTKQIGVTGSQGISKHIKQNVIG